MGKLFRSLCKYLNRISSDLKSILSHTIVKEDKLDYLLIYIPVGQIGLAKKLLYNLPAFSSVTYTSDEVSVVTNVEAWNNISSFFTGYITSKLYRLITFDIVLDLSIVGFLAVVSNALSREGVSIFALSTYLKDHILIKKDDTTKALNILNNLIQQSKL